jgi:hypothetical protein
LQQLANSLGQICQNITASGATGGILVPDPPACQCQRLGACVQSPGACCTHSVR